MIVDLPTFVAAFPEFANAAVYPPAQFAFWEAEAERELPAIRLGSSLPVAIMLFVAHNVSLSAQAARTVSGGGIAGGVDGPVSSKSVGPVSKSYDLGSSTLPGAGEFNLTGYGRRLYRLLKSAGSGPVYFPGPRAYPAPFGWR